MPFGLQGAPATFQCMMDRLIQGLEGFTAAYLDDLVIYSSTWEEHLQQLCQVFQRLQKAGLTAKPKKCQFAMQQYRYLGHIVGNGTVQPEQSKLAMYKCYQFLRLKPTSMLSWVSLAITEDLFPTIPMSLYHSLILLRRQP